MDETVQIHSVENLRDPVLVLAYAGWSDAGDAATLAVRTLMEQLEVTRFAQIDTEDFLDFTVVRPHVRLRDDGGREIVWPNHEFFATSLAPQPTDLLVGLGFEPHLRWKAYTDAMMRIVRAARVRTVVLLGALLDEVIYSRPVGVAVYTADAELAERLEVTPPSYEGPTGINGILADRLRREGVACVSLWARIPHYVPLKPNSRGALALLHTLEAVTELRFDLTLLKQQAAEFDQQVSEVISNDPELSAYVRELKRRVFSQ